MGIDSGGFRKLDVSSRTRRELVAHVTVVCEEGEVPALSPKDGDKDGAPADKGGERGDLRGA